MMVLIFLSLLILVRGYDTIIFNVDNISKINDNNIENNNSDDNVIMIKIMIIIDDINELKGEQAQTCKFDSEDVIDWCDSNDDEYVQEIKTCLFNRNYVITIHKKEY